MKKWIIGALSFGIIAAGGVTGVSAKSSQVEMPQEKNNHMMEMERMHQMMSESNAVINFGQAKNLMEQIHPEMTIQEIREMYTNMHGTNGAEPSNNFKEMEHNH
ncbi:hypothetical protein J0K78_10705 [Halobacillus sp. GSS1]|uniref:hypothetical protein n=1 Tax=Halobacillus sp. GSS1 TaxID=2815919 RepID=UPI001A8E1634|nr:hypothetical protein [Halobacillus sp. GSS1]MBN9654734.1 hypothetical protein [Halobacillus sp. GSS1]